MHNRKYTTKCKTWKEAILRLKKIYWQFRAYIFTILFLNLIFVLDKNYRNIFLTFNLDIWLNFNFFNWVSHPTSILWQVKYCGFISTMIRISATIEKSVMWVKIYHLLFQWFHILQTGSGWTRKTTKKSDNTK